MTSVSVDHEPGCLWRAAVSDSAGGGEVVVLVLGESTKPWPGTGPAIPRYLCLTLLNTTHLSTAPVGSTRNWLLASAPWERICR